MSKYIIKNCPSCTKQDDCIAMYLRTSIECKDRNDCVLKQIVELCLDYPEQCKIEGNCIDDRCCTSCFLGGGCELAQDILQLFEIEECE